MSAARKCDLCGRLHEPSVGLVTIDIHVLHADGETSTTWSETDLCQSCTANAIAFLKPALDGFDEFVAEQRQKEQP